MLALALRKNGVPVRIIDKEATFHNGSRGAGIQVTSQGNNVAYAIMLNPRLQPRTLEMLKILGVNPPIDSLCVPLPKMRSYKMPGGIEPLSTWTLVKKLDASPYIPFVSSIRVCEIISEDLIMRAFVDDHVRPRSKRPRAYPA